MSCKELGPICIDKSPSFYSTQGPTGHNDASDPVNPVIILKNSKSLNTIKKPPVDHLENINKFMMALWNNTPTIGNISPWDIPMGIKDMTDSNKSIEGRVKGGINAGTAMLAKYAFVAEKVGEVTLSRWLTASSVSLGFMMTSYELLSMLGQGYNAGHKIAKAKGHYRGIFMGITAALLWGGEDNFQLKQHLILRVSPDSIPGHFEVTAARGFNKGFIKGYKLFMKLPNKKRMDFFDMIFSQMEQTGDYNLFWRHRIEYEEINQATQTTIVMPYVARAIKIASVAKSL